jgi:methyl-accepting chemotaxis protein
MLALGWSLAGTMQAFSNSQVRADLWRRTQVATTLLEPLLITRATSVELAREVQTLGAVLQSRVTVVRPDGAILADSNESIGSGLSAANWPEIREAWERGGGTAQRLERESGQVFLYAAQEVEDGQAVIRLGVPLDDARALVSDIQRQIVIAALLAAGLMTGAGWFVAQRIGAALDALRVQAESIAGGKLDAAVEPVATRELGDLGRAFNVMTGQLRETVTELEHWRISRTVSSSPTNEDAWFTSTPRRERCWPLSDRLRMSRSWRWRGTMSWRHW